MRRTAKLLVPVLLLAGLGLLPAGAEPQQAFQLEGRVPATTLAFLSVEDVSSWGPRFEATALGQMLQDPEMQTFLKPVTEGLGQMVESGAAQVPPVVIELLQQLQNLDGQLAIALVDMDMERELPHLVASLDFGGHLDDFATFLDRMRTEMDPEGQQIRSQEKDGRTWWSVEGAPFPIHATTLDTAFVAATDMDLLQSVVSGTANPALAADSDFQAVRARAGGDDLGLYLYGNVDDALSRFGEMIPPDARKIADGLGLDTVASFAYGMSFKGDGFRDTLLIHAPKADHGLVPLIRMEPMTAPRTVDLAPAKTIWWGEANLPLDDLMARVRSLVGQIDADATEKMDEAIQQADQMLGVDLEKEILGGLAGPYGLYAAMPVGGGLYPELGVIFVVKDPARYEDSFDRLAKGIAGLLNEDGDVLAGTRAMDYHGVTMHLFEMQSARGKKLVPFTPTWALIDDRLVVTAVPHTMKEIILRAGGETREPGLAMQPEFQALMARKPAEAGAVEYLDLKSILSLVYDTGVPLLQTLVKPNMLEDLPITLDWALLPPTSRISKYFRSMAEYMVWNEDGIELSVHGPIPMLPLIGVAAGAAMWTGMRSPMGLGRSAMPDFVVTEEAEMPGGSIDAEMNLELAKIQLEMLYEAVEFFRQENDRLPNTFEDLVSNDLLGAVPKDPWGGVYRMRHTDGEFAVESAGPDKVFGTTDDVRHEP